MVLEFLLFGCGLYLLFTIIKMKSSGEIPATLVNKRFDIAKHLDSEGYIKYMFPRGLVFGFLLSGSSAMMILANFIQISPYVMLFVQLAYLVGVVYYAVITIKAQKKFVFKG